MTALYLSLENGKIKQKTLKKINPNTLNLKYLKKYFSYNIKPKFYLYFIWMSKNKLKLNSSQRMFVN